jgi:TetR/AcrR family transcriptional regulator, regulator of cefoperazone and chloramphenicol sensitivity
MTPHDSDPKERILTATAAILKEQADPAEITVRQIADRAGVSLGAINYHFQSKDNLLNEAVGRIVGDLAAGWYQPLQHADVDPLTRLRRLFKESTSIVVRYPKFVEMTIAPLLLQGDFSVPMLIVPLLREILGPEQSELELRLRAFELVVALQVVGLRNEAFRRYSGVDLFNEAQRDAAVDILIDNVIHKK